MQDKQKNYIDIFYQNLSLPRMQKYHKYLSSSSERDILCAHTWDLTLSRSFYPPLRLLEIMLRNSLHDTLSKYYGINYWFEHQEICATAYMKSTLNGVKKKLAVHHKKPHPDRIISSLGLGYWTSLFDSRFEHRQVLWPKLLRNVFPGMPKNIRIRKHISQSLNKMRLLRNRIYHYQPVWYWEDLASRHELIIEIISWIEPRMLSYTEFHNDFTNLYSDGWVQYRRQIDTLLTQRS